MSRGNFVVIEGLDGCGKSTQAEMLADFLRSQGFSVLLTHEPQKRDIGRLIKEKLVKKRHDYSPRAIALAFAADRMLHLEETVKPALEENDFVISDRYYHSSLVYQVMHGCRWEWEKELNRYAMKPDLTFIIDIPVEEFVRRRGATDEVFENHVFQKKVRKAYLALPGKLDEEIIIIDGTKSKEEVHRKIREMAVRL